MIFCNLCYSFNHTISSQLCKQQYGTVFINKHSFYFAAYVNVGAASPLGRPVSIRVVLLRSQSVLPVWLHSAAGVPKLAKLFMGYLITLLPHDALHDLCSWWGFVIDNKVNNLLSCTSYLHVSKPIAPSCYIVLISCCHVFTSVCLLSPTCTISICTVIPPLIIKF
jgi:hypothetical protein